MTTPAPSDQHAATQAAGDQGDKPPALVVRGLRKRFGTTWVVDGVDFDVQRGEVLCLLGPNGAGKTTSIRMLHGFLPADGGDISYFGAPLRTDAGGPAGRQARSAIKRRIGVCTQDDTLDPDFSVRDNLRVFARYFRPRRPDLDEHVEQLLARFGLARFADHRPEQLSGGYRRRLMIARSIVHDPDVLFLDEPTTGLDPKARVELWSLVAELRALGMAIILTTHYMDEAERLSDRLVVLQLGRVLAAGLPRDVLGGLLGEHTLVLPPDTVGNDDVIAWAEREGVRTQDVLGELRLMVEGAQLAAFTSAFPHAPLNVRPPNLDDLFLSLSEGDDAAEASAAAATRAANAADVSGGATAPGAQP